MQPVEYRINGIALPTGLSFFGQGLSPRFASSLNLITGALPAQYGLATSGIVDIETKDGLFAPGGSVTMYGGGNATLHPSLEYGGSVEGYNFYVAGDFLSTARGIDAVTSSKTTPHPFRRTQQGVLSRGSVASSLGPDALDLIKCEIYRLARCRSSGEGGPNTVSRSSSSARHRRSRLGQRVTHFPPHSVDR
jgi:hypothetical protein